MDELCAVRRTVSPMTDDSATPKFLAPLLVANDFAATLAFYRTALGLPVVGRTPYAECRTASSVIAIFDRGFFEKTPELDLPLREGTSPTSHTLISIEVPDLDETFERLIATGVPCLSSPSGRLPLGRKYLFLRDPDGRTVVLMGPRATPR